MANLAFDLYQGLLGVLFPPVCEHCNRVSSVGCPLCWRCIRLLERVDPAYTENLVRSLPMSYDGIEIRCLWYFDRQGPLRDVVHAFKYRNRPWHGGFLGRAISASLLDYGRFDAVVPLPLHRVRLLERGYNQADIMAAEVARAARAPLERGGLIRVSPTFTQTTLSRDKRWQNVRNAFAVEKSVITSGARGGWRDVVLVDDVVTTGATVFAAALTLRAAGVSHVNVVAAGLARA